MKKQIKFPQDFKERPHPIGISGCKQYAYPDFDQIKISVIIGNMFYSNGIDTYEMFDMEKQDNPQGHMTVEDINEYLKTRRK